jgi:hypothetical protein
MTYTFKTIATYILAWFPFMLTLFVALFIGGGK